MALEPQFRIQPHEHTLQVRATNASGNTLNSQQIRALKNNNTDVLIERFIAAANPRDEQEPLEIRGIETYRDIQFLEELREQPDHTQASIHTESKLLQLTTHKQQYRLQADNNEIAHIFGREQLWMYTQKNDAVEISELRINQESLHELSEQANTLIPLSFLKTILEQYWPAVQGLGRTPLEHEIPRIQETPTPRLYLTEQEQELTIQLRFAYANQEILAGDTNNIYIYDNNTLTYVKRDEKTEEFYALQFKQNNIKPTRDGYTPKNNPYEWLTEDVNELLELGFEVYGKQALMHFKTHQPQLSITTSKQPDWLELKAEVTFGNHTVPPRVLLEMLRGGQKYIKLSDESTGVIPQKWLNKLQDKLALLELTEQGAKIHPAHTPIVQEFEELADTIEHDQAFQELKETFESFEEIQEATLPTQLNATLREYQQAGYNWLRFLHEHLFGGILADDMGLGKTLTSLTLLAWVYEQQPTSKFLIIVPTSLVDNWVEERNKFVKHLPIYTQYGQSRHQRAQDIPNGLVITSYNTLRNDIEFMKEVDWNYVLLDESHAIKNPTSQIARAINQLRASHRIAISGTPIENNVTELWSQMNFANPGLLGSYDAFTSTYQDPDKVQQEELKSLIKPFILRRTKQSVAKDLPEKTILKQYCRMSDEQASLYEATKNHLQEEVRKELQENGASNKIFLALLRLRQLANHPRLISDKYQASSGKFEALFDKIHEAIAEDHKILIFSSFTSLLDIIQEQMTQYTTLRIDGSTQNRQELVKEFQTNPVVNAFLISLKAGGVGLTLTAADYVFIVDPWWNPQAEMQAIDRAHRIGQENPVFVYKFITQYTVEEKIARLQEDKLELANNLITTEEGFVKQLSKEDLLTLFE